MKKKQKVVVMGGGTGTFPVITALKQLQVEIAAIISVSDSGGSTGRIRDEFGFQPVGDLRQSLAALADLESQQWIQKLLLYRFSKGAGLQGHNLGNLILTALQDLTENTTQALSIAETIFKLEGSVIPVTQEIVSLKIHYADGSTAIGEHILDEQEENPKTIDHVSLEPQAELNPRAIQEILNADLIIIGPGDHYASILSTLVVSGIPEVFAQSTAPIAYFANLMTRRSQTHNMSVQDHVRGIEQVIKKKLDYICINTAQPSSAVISLYKAQGEFPVVDDMESQRGVLRADLLLAEPVPQQGNDAVPRSLIRHDAQKIKQLITQLLKQL